MSTAEPLEIGCSQTVLVSVGVLLTLRSPRPQPQSAPAKK